MKKIILSLFLTAMAAAFAMGQNDDYKKTEVYVGYSNGQVDMGIDSGNSINSFLRDRANFHGFEVAGVYNVSRYVGVKGDISGTYNNRRFSFPIVTGNTTTTGTVDTKNSLYNFAGGIQVKDNASAGRFKPFAHAMVGAGHGRSKFENCSPSSLVLCNGTQSDTGFAGIFGGGLDIRVNDKVDFRAFQVDYNPMRFDGQTDHNVRLGIGIVIK